MFRWVERVLIEEDNLRDVSITGLQLRFMMIVKTSKDSEAGVMPSGELLMAKEK